MSPARYLIGLWLWAMVPSAWAQATTDGGAALSPGWFVAAKHDGEYVVEANANGVCGGRSAIARSLKPTVSGNVSVMQIFRADKYRNTRVRFSATVDAADVTGWAGVWLRVDGPDKKTLGFDNMQNRAIQGTQRCQRASVVLDVPAYAESIALGLVLNGGGRAELSNLLLETVDSMVPTTNLAPPPDLQLTRDAGLPSSPPAVIVPSESEPKADALGRVGLVWFNDRAIIENASGRLRPGSGSLHLVSPDFWSDRPGDFTATRRGDAVLVKGLDPSIGMLVSMTGELKMRREGDTTIIEGTWGASQKYPVLIRLSRKKLDMTWGFYERHLVAEASPQAPPNCVYFSKRTGGLAIPPSDALQICGEVFETNSPPIQTIMAFLMTGFHRFDGN